MCSIGNLNKHFNTFVTLQLTRVCLLPEQG